MARTRDNYQVTGRTVEELVRNLNFLLQRVADRMDRIEGIRGTSSIESALDMNSNRITEVADAVEDTDALNREQADLTGASPTFTSMTISEDLDVGGDITVYDADGNLIHSLE